METIKQIVRIPKEHEIKIKIPQHVPENETAEVILFIKKKPDSFKQKIDELKEAMNDELFIEDLRDISQRFKAVDLEEWE